MLRFSKILLKYLKTYNAHLYENISYRTYEYLKYFLSEGNKAFDNVNGVYYLQMVEVN